MNAFDGLICRRDMAKERISENKEDLMYVCVCVCVCARARARSVVSDSLQPHGL